jgi:hypothetical protein
LLVDGRLQLISLERLVLGRPAIGLHDLQRIGRCHQDLGKERIGIECNRSNQLIELFRLEQLLLRLGRCGRGSRLCLRHCDLQHRQQEGRNN